MHQKKDIETLSKLFTTDTNTDTAAEHTDTASIPETEDTELILFTPATQTDMEGVNSLQTLHVIMQDDENKIQPPPAQHSNNLHSQTHLIAHSVPIQPMADRQHYALANIIIQQTEITQKIEFFSCHLCNAIINDKMGKPLEYW